MEIIWKNLASAEKEVLIDIVKSVQKRNLKGAKGEWKDFLVEYDSQLGDSLLDPKKRSPESMVAFLKTFTKERDLKQLNKSCIGFESSPQKLASLTFEHPEYPKCFSFPSYDESTRMLSVDCEMVLCEDKTEGLVQVCVVNRNLEVKLNELVKLDKPVADYRTQIHGINAKDLERATCSLEDIQKSMEKLLSNGVILIGHGLDRDLKALKVDHARVIDTSLIFKYPEGHTHKRPSLNHLCKTVLGYDLRESDAPHHCLADAQATMKLVLAKLEHKFDGVIPLKSKEVLESDGVIPLKSKKVLESDGVVPLKSKEVLKSDGVVPLKSKDVFEIESVELFFHAVPLTVSQKQLRGLFPKDSTVKFQASFDGEMYIILLLFSKIQRRHAMHSKVLPTKDLFRLRKPRIRTRNKRKTQINVITSKRFKGWKKKSRKGILNSLMLTISLLIL
ncbi:hypothetical protein MKX01_022378 [Papaver californicum]|nr:hypothetical protein MKX01_022378 [Papaver californicum]